MILNLELLWTYYEAKQNGTDLTFRMRVGHPHSHSYQLGFLRTDEPLHCHVSVNLAPREPGAAAAEDTCTDKYGSADVKLGADMFECGRLP